METFTQPKITGYRELSETEVVLMNRGKALAQQCGQFIEELRAHVNSDGGNANGILPPLDKRWINIGATELQQGFMAVLRGIAQPSTF